VSYFPEPQKALESGWFKFEFKFEFNLRRRKNMSDEKKTKEKESALTSKSLFSVGGLFLILFILILVNIIFSQINLRWDSTSDKLYSLSEGTKKIISEMEENVTIKVFYTKDNVNTPVHIKTYAQRMLDFLSEYEHYSDGKITVEVYDVKTDSDEEDWARSYGMEGINLPTGERIYFGLVAMAADQEETIKYLDPAREKHLEYDVTRIITRVQTPKKKKVGIISGFPVFGESPGGYNMPNQFQKTPPWLFVTELKKTYDVSNISFSSETIDTDIDLLIIIHPKILSEKLQYAVDQFVLRGGNVILFSDPLAIMDTTPGQSQASIPEKLLTAWGVKMESAKVVVDFDYSTSLMTGQNQVENSPLWISLQPESFNSENIITGKLESMLLPIAGAIQQIPQSGLEYEPLLQSSTNASLVEGLMVRFGVSEIRRIFKPSNKNFDLAATIRGVFKTAFPNGRPETDKNDSQDNKQNSSSETVKSIHNHLNVGKKNSTLIIIADADLLFDNYYVNKQNFLGFNISSVFNDNLNFLLNATEMLTGNQELINIRSGGRFERPFTRVQELEKSAQARWLATEQELVRKVEETNQELRVLERQKDATQQFIISEKQEAEIQIFKQEKLRINKELKKVRRNLRADIESLGSALKFINIFLMPLLVSMAGIFYALYKRKKMVKGI
jgi:ABC-type uncharacterized transport system involved in gliding motility auxiliary subunit